MDYTACDEWESAKLLHRGRQRTTLNMENSFYIVSQRKDRTALQWIPPVSISFSIVYQALFPKKMVGLVMVLSALAYITYQLDKYGN
jgi:hypothetical protein